MSYSQALLFTEVKEEYARLSQACTLEVDKPALVKAVMDRHGSIGRVLANAHPEDRDYAFFLIHRGVCEIVQRFFREVEEDEEDPGAVIPRLEGFGDHIQAAYSIERDGLNVIVPFLRMTAQELRSKARELRSMASGLMAHADELDRAADVREQAGN